MKGIWKFGSYAYCLNNPIRYIDPKGRDVWDFIGGIVHSVGSNLALETVPTNANFVSDAGDYNAGRTVGDLVSIVMGVDEIIVGGGAAGIGAAATVGTGGTASPISLPAAAIGVGMTVHGSGVVGAAIKSLATQEGRVTQGTQARDSSKNEKHGDSGRSLKKAEDQIKKLDAQKEGAPKKERERINKKIENIRRTAEKNKKGTEDTNTGKRK